MSGYDYAPLPGYNSVFTAGDVNIASNDDDEYDAIDEGVMRAAVALERIADALERRNEIDEYITD